MEIEIKLTPTQEKALSYIINNGSIMARDMWNFYSTEKSSRNAIDRLVFLGFLKENSEVFGKFTYTGKKY